MIDCQLVDQGGFPRLPRVCLYAVYRTILLSLATVYKSHSMQVRDIHIFFFSIQTTVIVVWIMTRTREQPCCCCISAGSLVWDYSEPVGNGVQLQCQTKSPDKSHHSLSLVPKGMNMSIVAEEG